MSASIDVKIKLTLREAVAIAGINGKLSSSQYKMLAGWLGCYSYIIPADRYLSWLLMDKLTPHGSISTPTDAFKLWMITDWIYSSVSAEEQQRILLWMSD